MIAGRPASRGSARRTVSVPPRQALWSMLETPLLVCGVALRARPALASRQLRQHRRSPREQHFADASVHRQRPLQGSRAWSARLRRPVSAHASAFNASSSSSGRLEQSMFDLRELKDRDVGSRH